MPEEARNKVQRQLFIRSFFEISPPPELAELLAERMRDRIFEENDVIFARGEPSGSIFFVTSGQVELSAPNEAPWVFEGKAFIGGFDANIGRNHQRTARALSRSLAVEIHFDEYLMILEDFFDFSRSMIVLGSERTSEASLNLAPYDVLSKPTRPVGKWLDHTYLDEVQRLLVLHNSAPFCHAPIQALVDLAHYAIEERYREGEAILTVNDHNTGMHIIADGLVRTHLDTPFIQSMAGPGDLVLGVGALPLKPYIYSATAATDVVILRLSHEDLFDGMEEHFALTRSWWVYLGDENERIRSEIARQKQSQGQVSNTASQASATRTG